MTSSERRKARAGLDPARAAIARFDRDYNPEDLAADLIETWQAVESSLRSLVGSTVLSGQALIREARQRQLLNFDQANALAELQAVNDRLQDVGYSPTQGDAASARSAVLELDAALTGDGVGVAGAPITGPISGPAAGEPIQGLGGEKAKPLTGEVKSMGYFTDGSEPVKTVAPPRRIQPWMLITLAGVLVLGLLGGAGYFFWQGRKPTSLEHGMEAYRLGQRESAVNAFNRAAREDPKNPLPHIYLARMAREVGNFTLASQELQLALQADPSNAVALREMGAVLLTQGNYDLARRFYVRAVEADPSDSTAQGYLGCTLMRLNRVTEATNFLNRAGPGPWSNCTPANPQSRGTQSTNPR